MHYINGNESGPISLYQPVPGYDLLTVCAQLLGTIFPFAESFSLPNSQIERCLQLAGVVLLHGIDQEY